MFLCFNKFGSRVETVVDFLLWPCRGVLTHLFVLFLFSVGTPADLLFGRSTLGESWRGCHGDNNRQRNQMQRKAG